MTRDLESLERALTSPGDRAALRELRARSKEVLAALDDGRSRAQLDEAVDLRDVDPDWLAEVYEALATAEAEVESPPEEAFCARDQDDEDIGRAIGEVLLPGLPRKLNDLGRWLVLAPDVDPRRVEILGSRRDVLAAETFPSSALRKGVTPVVLFNAFEAMATLFHRARHKGHVSRARPLTLDCLERSLQAGPDPIRAEVVVTEVGMMSDCESDVARALCHWMIPVSWCVPRVFGSVQVSMAPAGIELSAAGETTSNLFERFLPTRYPSQLAGLSELIEACLPVQAEELVHP
jgi:hypothetical protein